MTDTMIPIRPLNREEEPGSKGTVAQAAPKVKKSVEAKKLEKRIVRLTGQAICDFGMIAEGDKVGVAMSGGKDSYVLLETLLKLQKRAPIHFDIMAINVDMNMPGFPHELLPEYFRKIGVAYHIERQDTYKTILKLIPTGQHICSLCSRLRRGILYSAADRLGITKIALGHQMDDIVSTLLLNMFYSGRLKGMPPVLRSDDGRHIVIRPLAYVRESETARWARLQGYPLIPKNLCGLAENKKRHEIKEMMKRWNREDGDRLYNIFMSMTRVTPSHLMDRTLWDFSNFKALAPDTPPLKPRRSRGGEKSQSR
ncbi:MAG: tRNA 2-thiocytidine(32) synthetase TtcA [Mesosutterella sp.]|nr:tRNA 2-thiocytidine(32) synthetase TtcA [Mesosutterella sp.]